MSHARVVAAFFLASTGALVLTAAPAAAGVLELDLYDRPVACSAQQGFCRYPDGSPAIPEHLRREFFITRQPSRFVGGIHLVLELARPGGAIGRLEVDLPGPRLPLQHAVLTYTETREGALVFAATSGEGRIELPPEELGQTGTGCTCTDRRFELRFFEQGPDGVLGSADDAVRRLSRMVLSYGQVPCAPARLMELPTGIVVSPLAECREPATPGSPDQEVPFVPQAPVREEPGSFAGEQLIIDEGCGYQAPEEVEMDGGCGGEDPGWETDQKPGCEGDPAGAEDPGCEGSESDEYACDGGGSSDYACDGGGGSSDYACDGGGGSSEYACEGTAAAALKAGRPRRRRSGALGLLLPVLCFGLLHGFMKRRDRASRRRVLTSLPG